MVRPSNWKWWEIHGKALRKFGSGSRMSILKFIHGRAATNEREHRFYSFRSPLCYTCQCNDAVNDYIDNHAHIIKCKKCVTHIKLRKNTYMI
jgi:ATP:corrinoid adenosyltransferase